MAVQGVMVQVVLTKENNATAVGEAALLGCNADQIVNDLMNLGRQFRTLSAQAAHMGFEIRDKNLELKESVANQNRGPQEPAPEDVDNRTVDEKLADLRRLGGIS